MLNQKKELIFSKEDEEIIKKELGLEKCPTHTFQRFIYQCAISGLHPLLGQAFLIKRLAYEDGQAVERWVFQPGKDGLLARAKKFPDFKGCQSGYIMKDDEFHCDLGSGEVSHKIGLNHFSENELPIGAWAKILIEGKEPTVRVVQFEERAQYKKDGTLIHNWKSKPGTMIEKCAVAAALRDAYPDKFSGIYEGQEIDGVLPAINEGSIALEGTGAGEVKTLPAPAPVPIQSEELKIQTSKLRRHLYELEKKYPEQSAESWLKEFSKSEKSTIAMLDRATDLKKINWMIKDIEEYLAEGDALNIYSTKVETK